MFYDCVLSVIQLQIYSAIYTNVYSLQQRLPNINRLQQVEENKIVILYEDSDIYKRLLTPTTYLKY